MTEYRAAAGEPSCEPACGLGRGRVVPLVGLLVLLAEPSYDLIWENHPAHFWLVVLVGALSFAIGFLLAEAAARRADARVLLIGVAFLATSGYLVLHALATPGVLLAEKNAGFQIASAIGLLEAGLFAAASAVRFHPETSAFLVRYRGVIYGLLVLHMAAWAAISLSTLPPLDDPLTPEDTRGPLAALAVVGLLAYGFGVWRYWQLYREPQRPLPLAILVALVLPSEAMFAVAFARNWQTTWWEWHLLMLVAFGVVGLAARREWRARRLVGGDLQRHLRGADARTPGGGQRPLRRHAGLHRILRADARSPRSRRCWTPTSRLRPQFLQSHDGELYNTIGDALMVVFRGPEPRSARRAHGPRVPARDEAGSRTRTQVGPASARGNSGDALLGVIDAPGQRGYTATGDTVNLASRLEGQARAGEVVVSETTYAGLAERAEVEELEPAQR